ncbi:hypothetical protein GCM10022248_33950 [Nonomuraea soli]
MKEILLAVALMFPQASGHPVKVYFPTDGNYPPQLAAAKRVSPDLGLARFVVQQFVAGPTKAERRRGMFSNFKLIGPSDCGGDFQITIKQETARVRFCRTAYGPGHLGDAVIIYALKANLTQFPSIKKAVLADKDNRCLFSQADVSVC